MQAAQSVNRYTSKPVFQSDEYTIWPNRVVQGQYEAKALSPTELISNYQSPARDAKSPLIYFKFSLNGFDNEMEWGQDHQVICKPIDGVYESPVIQFGRQFIDNAALPPDNFLMPQTTLRLRLDMREVLAAFRQQGYFTAYNGERIYRRDFKGVFVAGSIPPLSWNFDRLGYQKDMQLHDADGDGIYDITLELNPPAKQNVALRRWELTYDISGYPRYETEHVLLTALYNLSLEEMEKDIEPDKTFRTGLEWAGVWTRDVSYSTILAMAILHPDVARNSLLRKVKNNHIVQDTGTGGAYPVSTDRMIWAVAAWEIYEVTGDNDWLKYAFSVIKNSVSDDVQNAYDAVTGLVHGESSFLDWREQTYPDWMQPADIYESFCLGTNAVHYQANVVLARMATLLHDFPTSEKCQSQAEKIKAGINKYFWQPDKNYYGQFLYGRLFKTLSPRAEALGAALCVLFDIADPERQRLLVENNPVQNFGIPCIFPQTPGIPPYHNNAVWPFVQAFWSLAAAKAGNEKALRQSLSALYRPSALFLTNKENFALPDGDYSGTQINSDEMLWSLSGSLAMVYKVIFGINFQPDKLVFKPFVPEAFGQNHKLTNFRYRQAILDIQVTGFGNQIRAISLNDTTLEKPEIPATLTGRHAIRIILANNAAAGNAAGKINLAADTFSPATPRIYYNNNRLSWPGIPGAVTYKLLKNGQETLITQENQVSLDSEEFGEYQVIAVDAQQYQSFASEPLWVMPEKTVWIYEAELFARKSDFMNTGFSGSGAVEISRKANPQLNFNLSIPAAGMYALDFRYANGNGPVTTNNKCAFRTLRNGNAFLGTIVFPQRGDGQWSNWGFSNAVITSLPAGNQVISLCLEPANENMNVEVNQAMLDYLRVIKIKD